MRADGAVRWVLDRGQLVPGPGGRLWLDGALFDITERRAAEEALLRREIEAARTEELRASRARIVAGRRRRAAQDRARPARRRAAAAGQHGARRAGRARPDRQRTRPPADRLLDRLGDELKEALAELRELARGIHPAVLTERGLAPAVAALAQRAPVPVEVIEVPDDAAARCRGDDRVLHGLRGADQRGQVRAGVARDACDSAARTAQLVVEVRDDGVGGADPANGSGLRGLADRVGAADGELSVVSPPGEGTLVRAVLPL